MKSLFILLAVAVVGFWLGPQIIENSPFVIGAVAAVFFLILALTNFETGLMMLLFIIPLSVQTNVASFAGDAPLDVGMDDFFIFLLFLVWLVWLGKNKQAPFVSNPMTGPFFVYLIACLISFLPMLMSGLGEPYLSLFHLVKWYEYVFIYFVVVKCLETREQIVRFAVLAIGSGIFIAVIQVFQLMLGIAGGGGDEVARFATASFESNGILGSFYVFFLAILVSFLAKSESQNQRTYLMVFAGLLSFTLFYTFSRAAYLGMVVSLLVLGALHRKKLVFMGFLIVFAIPVMVNKVVFQEITKTVSVEQDFSEGKKDLRYEIETGGGKKVELDMSSTERLMAWQKAWRVFMQSPIFGTGYWSARFIRTFHFHTIHSQYLTVLVETGFLGFFAFIWLVWRLFSNAVKFGRETQDPFYRDFARGVAAGFVGILVHCVFGETFESFRMTGPLWMIVGILFAAKRLDEEGRAYAQQAQYVE